MTRDKKFREGVKRLISGRVLFDEPMWRHTSIGVGGPADALVFPRSVKEFSHVISYLCDLNVPFMPVGNCTNLLIRDGGYRGALLSLRGLTAVNYRPADLCTVYAEAGVSLSEIVNLCARESLTGMEFCAGIPGSVGGGVKMNAGAFGRELVDVVETVALMNGTGEIKVVHRNDLRFEYRNLDLPERMVIIGAKFLLARGSKEKIEEKVSEITGTRKERHPLEQRSAGSIFRNPPDISAGEIIEEIGLKGVKIGGAKISEVHGNFIVNSESAEAKDVLALIDLVRKKVWEERGISLKCEVKIIGED
jgi:UDP-N-acetylmuramate dehydrogenase